MGCKMSKRMGRKAKNTKSKDNPTATSGVESEDKMLLDVGEIQGMKRAQLQKLCKQFGLKATGKVWNWLSLSQSPFYLKHIDFKTLKSKVVVALFVESL